ncbi:MAG: TetR/AcrR family transcriptional regulator [Desulfosalsimonas sp.]
MAGDVFYRKGFKESSLQDISSKGNLSKAGIYHYYFNSSLDGLLVH